MVEDNPNDKKSESELENKESQSKDNENKDNQDKKIESTDNENSNKDGETQLTLDNTKKIIKKYEVENGLLKTKLEEKDTNTELIKKHESELKEYRLKDKINRFSKILSLMIKDTKKLEERAVEYAKDETITEKFLQKIVDDSLLLVSTSSSKIEDKNDMLSLADSMIVSTSSTTEIDDKKPFKSFNESIAGYYAGLF